MVNRIRIDDIRVKDLYSFANQIQAEVKSKPIVPIGNRRALAWSRNPYADEKDIGLLVAYLGNQCIGYLGIMPGLLRRGDEFAKVHWLSTWYVGDEFRNSSVGSLLMLRAMALQYDLAVIGMSEEAERIYRALGFNELGSVSFYFLNLEILNASHVARSLVRRLVEKTGMKWQIPEAIFRSLASLYPSLRKGVYNVLLWKFKECAGKVIREEVMRLEGEDTVRRQDPNVVEFHRGVEAINWMLEYKWPEIRNTGEASEKNYYFAEHRDVFRFFALKLYSSSKGEYLGFVVLSLGTKDQKTVLKVLDFQVRNAHQHRYVVRTALEVGARYGADGIEFPEALGLVLWEKTWIGLYLRKRKRYCLTRPRDKKSFLAVGAEKIRLSHCDGDLAFT